MIKVSNISKSFPDVVALADVSFVMNRGVNVIVGPNGAGKTTTLKCLAGVMNPDSGIIEIFGKSVWKVKKEIAFLDENRRVFRKFKVRDYEQMLPLLYENWDERLFKKLLAHFSIGGERRVEKLSAGIKTLFLFSVVASSGAKVLILDEPTQHLDPMRVSDVQEILKELGQDRVVVIASHHMEEVESFADRFVIINKGRVLYQDEIDVAKEKHRVVSQSEIGQYDEVIQVVESGWLVRTDEDKGRYPSLREITLAYLKRDKEVSLFDPTILEEE